METSPGMDKAPSLVRSRVILTTILFFAAVADTVTALIAMMDIYFGIVKVFIALSTLFILQHYFKWFRILLIAAFILYVFAISGPALWGMDVLLLIGRQLTEPAVLPLYGSLVVITLFTIYLFKKYDLLARN